VCNVAVVGIVQRIAVCAVLRCLDGRAGEATLHVCEQPFAVSGTIGSASFAIQLGQLVVKLEQNAGTPERDVGVLGGELQKKVTLSSWHQYAGVENSSVHRAILSDRPIYLRVSGPCGPQRGEQPCLRRRRPLRTR
jgi:hypothetical protein